MEIILGTEGNDVLDVVDELRVEGFGGDDVIDARGTPQINAGDGNDRVTIVDPAPTPGTGGAGVALGNGADGVSVADLGPEITLFEISPGVPLVDFDTDTIELSRSAFEDVAAGVTRRIAISGVDGQNDRVVFPDLRADEVTVSTGNAPTSSFPSVEVRFGQTVVELTQFSFDDLTQILEFNGGGGVANQSPLAIDDATMASTSLIAIDVLANDSDPDGDQLEILSVDTTGTLGTVLFVPGVDEDVRYFPPSAFTGTDSFRYTITDERGETASALVTISAAGTTPPPPPPPTPGPQTVVYEIGVISGTTVGDGEMNLIETPTTLRVTTQSDGFLGSDDDVESSALPSATFVDVNAGIVDLVSVDTISFTFPVDGGRAEAVYGIFDVENQGVGSRPSYFFLLEGTPLPDFAPGTDLGPALESIGGTFDFETPGFGPNDLIRWDAIPSASVLARPETLTDADARAVAYLYETALDRDGNIDLEGLNFWIDVREGATGDAPVSAVALAQFFLDSPEFAASFDDPNDFDDRGLVELLYFNVLDRAGEASGVDFWTGAVSDPAFSRADLLLAFATAPENTAGLTFVETLDEVSPGEWAFVA